MKGYFVTGTDTGVGKTLATVALTRALVARGLRVAVMKPVAAGTVKTPEGEFNDDALDLLAASNVKASYEDVNPWLLQTPASPHLAARFEGVSIRHERIVGAYLRLAKDADVLKVLPFLFLNGRIYKSFRVNQDLGRFDNQFGFVVDLEIGYEFKKAEPSKTAATESEGSAMGRAAMR